MIKKKLWIMAILGALCCFLPLAGAKAQNINTPTYKAGEIIVKYKEGKGKELDEILKDKKMRGNISIKGIEKEKIRENVFNGKFKDGDKQILNTSIYKIPDLKNKASDFLQTVRDARNYMKERIMVRTREFGDVFVNVKEKEIIDPYTKEMLEKLNSDPNVLYAQINHLVKVSSFTPSDPYYSLSWALENSGQDYPISVDKMYKGKDDADIDAREGWAFDKSNGGEGIIIGVVDTGIDYTHEDFGSCTIEEIRDGNPLTCPKFVAGYDVYNKDNDPMDDNGHGTICSGILGALNNDKGIVGVAYNARLIAVKGLGKDGTGSDFDLAKAVIWAVDNGADVLNASWGVEANSDVLKDAFDYAYSKGVVSAVAAGNGFGKDSMLYSPAKYDTVITVGSVNSYDMLSSFSNRGPKIDVVAPGEYILSARASGTGNSAYAYNEKYFVASGTSMSTPYVAGAVALVLANNREYSNEDVRKALRDGADDLGESGVDDFYGAGRLNLANVLKKVQPNKQIFAKIKSPNNNEIISNSFYVGGSVIGSGCLVENWQLFYKKDGSEIGQKVLGDNCFGNKATPSFACKIDTKGWEDGKIYNIELVANSGKETIKDTKTVMFVGVESPLNLTANGANPSPHQDNSEFIINWKYPNSNYRGAFYKLGSPPLSNEDGIAINTKPFKINATAEGGQNLFVWLENFRGDKNYENYAKVSLNYGASSLVNVPSNPSARAVGAKIIFNWEAVQGCVYPVLGYNIYKSISREFNDIPYNSSLIAETSYAFDGLEKGVVYYFATQAVDIYGNKSELSSVVSAKIDPSSDLRSLVIGKIRERLLKWRENNGG